MLMKGLPKFATLCFSAGLLAGCATGDLTTRAASPVDQKTIIRTGDLAGPAVCDNDVPGLRADRLNAAVHAAQTWMRAHTSLPAIGQPCIVWAAQDHTQILRAALPAVGTVGASPLASFNCTTFTIYLREDTFGELDNPVSISMIVHELVHHAQCLEHGFGGTRCQKERQAYRVQADYLRYLARNGPTFVSRNFLLEEATRYEQTAEQLCRAIRYR